jgi:proline iminopeptidase
MQRIRWSGLTLLLLLILGATSALQSQAPGRAPALTDGEYRATLNGVEHWYRVAGAANRTTPLVIVHGGPGGNTYAFERTAGPGLERFATVVYYHQRGSGHSAAAADSNAYSVPILVADLDALRQRLGAERIDVLGYSFGGELALEYALAHPEQVRRLVLEAPSMSDWDRMRRAHLAGFLSVTTGAQHDSLAALAVGPEPLEVRWARVWDAVDSRTVDRLLFEDSARAAANRRMERESGLRNTGAMFRALQRQPQGRPLLERAAATRVPTLVLVGRHDRNVGAENVLGLAHRIPGAMVVILEKSAHFPDAEEPEFFVESVREFLR